MAWHPAAASAACVRHRDAARPGRRSSGAARAVQKGAAVAHIGGGHLDLADQAEGVDQQVALAAVDLLGAVVVVSSVAGYGGLWTATSSPIMLSADGVARRLSPCVVPSTPFTVLGVVRVGPIRDCRLVHYS
jgi:hypothetical protein